MRYISFPWFIKDWRRLQHMLKRLPHAFLFYGPEGIGKTSFAEAFAQSLLCQTPKSDGQACHNCPSCLWFLQHNHPDYRCVCPEIFDYDTTTDNNEEEKTVMKVNKTLSKEIKINQIRSLFDFMNISTHRSGMRVVTLYPAEALNTAASNSLLKMLEEPPPETIFLLVSNRRDRLLPTILSRCRQFSLTLPSRDEGLIWLKQCGVQDANFWLSAQGGAPLAALHASQNGNREKIHEFLMQLSYFSIDEALRIAEHLQKVSIVDLVSWQQRWLYDLLALKLGLNIRYYPDYSKELKILSCEIDIAMIIVVLKATNKRRAIVDRPLSVRLFIEEMLINYSQLFVK